MILLFSLLSRGDNFLPIQVVMSSKVQEEQEERERKVFLKANQEKMERK